MSNSRFATVAETISALEHSDLPTIIVEGSDDIIIYREIEKQIEDADVMPVGGRNAVLEIFRNKLINPKLQNKKIVFIADKDTWVNIGIPPNYQHDSLIFTHGYSLENDVFMDYGCELILNNETAEIRQQFEKDKNQFIHWYALALQAHLQGKTADPQRQIGKSPKNVLNQFENLIVLKPNETYPTTLETQLKNNYQQLLRGKSLLDLFTKNMKHHTPKAMFQQVAVRPNTRILAIFEQVKNQYQNIH